MGHGPDSCKLAKCVFVPRLQIETSQTKRSNAMKQTRKQCLTLFTFATANSVSLCCNDPCYLGALTSYLFIKLG